MGQPNCFRGGRDAWRRECRKVDDASQKRYRKVTQRFNSGKQKGLPETDSPNRERMNLIGLASTPTPAVTTQRHQAHQAKGEGGGLGNGNGLPFSGRRISVPSSVVTPKCTTVMDYMLPEPNRLTCTVKKKPYTKRVIHSTEGVNCHFLGIYKRHPYLCSS